MQTQLTAAFEEEATIDSWHADYYAHPVAQRYYDRAVQRMLQQMGARAGDRVLDAGCGTGCHSVRCAKMGCDVEAVDVSASMLREAQQHVRAAGCQDRIHLTQQDVTQLDYPDDTFDHVFCWGVLIHIPDLEATFAELARVLRPGGRLALYVTNGAAIDHKVEALARWLLRRPEKGQVEYSPFGIGYWHRMHGHWMLTWRIDPDAVTRHLGVAGLQRTHQITGEFTELQRRLHGLPRSAMLRWNALWHRLHAPARPAACQLLIFTKPPEPAIGEAAQTSPFHHAAEARTPVAASTS